MAEKSCETQAKALKAMAHLLSVEMRSGIDTHLLLQNAVRVAHAAGADGLATHIERTTPALDTDASFNLDEWSKEFLHEAAWKSVECLLGELTSE